MHAPSYYAATAHPSPPRPPLVGVVRADVCIIGAGFTGISAGLALAERGYAVIVLEAARVGWGASGRNGGQMINGYSRDLDEIEWRYGADAARGLGAMAREGAAIIRERVARYGISCDLVDGNFVAAFTGRQMRDLERQKLAFERHGHDGQTLIDRAGVDGFVATDRYVGGLFDPKGGHLHPLNLVLGEAATLEGLGGVIHETSRAIAVDRAAGAEPVVRTAQGEVRAATVLVCGNAYLGDLLHADIGSKIMPVSSQVATTVPLGEEVASALLPANACVEDSNYFLDYFRRTADHRLLYGGGTVYGGRDPASIEAKLRPLIAKTFPNLRGVKLEYAWSGNFALTRTRVPHVGRLGHDIYFSHGDSGHGVTTTHLLGRLLGDAVAGQADRFDVFAGLPYRAFPGGRLFRLPMTVVGSWYYRMLDRIG